MKDEYTVLEQKLTDAEIEDFREAMREENQLAPARGVLAGVAVGAVAWAVFFGIVWTLMNLPGIP
jgi:hypothetical protein